MDFEKLAAPLVQVYEEVTDQILENIAQKPEPTARLYINNICLKCARFREDTQE